MKLHCLILMLLVQATTFDIHSEYESALEASRESGKNVVLFFTSHSCANDLKVQEMILSCEYTQSVLNTRFENAWLFVTNNNWQGDSNENADFMVREFRNIETPMMVILNADGNPVSRYMYSEEIFQWLNTIKSSK